MGINFTQFKAFHALAVTGGFTKAANYLHVSQPAVTTQLKAFEDTYGVALFNRRGHELTLTETGMALFECSKMVFHFLEEGDEILISETELQSGTLRVGSDNPFFIMDVLSAFKTRYPDVKVEVDMGTHSKIYGKLMDYEIDVAVMTLDLIPDEFFTEFFSPLSLMLLLPLDHPWSDRHSINLADIGDHPIISREADSSTRKTFVDALASIGAKPNIILELNDQVAVREAVAAGLGIAAELDGGLFPGNRLKLVPIADVAVSIKEYVVCRRERLALQKIKAFFDIAGQIAPNLQRIKRLIKK